jgi:hypothetical protein
MPGGYSWAARIREWKANLSESRSPADTAMPVNIADYLLTMHPSTLTLLAWLRGETRSWGQDETSVVPALMGIEHLMNLSNSQTSREMACILSYSSCLPTEFCQNRPVHHPLIYAISPLIGDAGALLIFQALGWGRHIYPTMPSTPILLQPLLESTKPTR